MAGIPPGNQNITKWSSARNSFYRISNILQIKIVKQARRPTFHDRRNTNLLLHRHTDVSSDTHSTHTHNAANCITMKCILLLQAMTLLRSRFAVCTHLFHLYRIKSRICFRGSPRATLTFRKPRKGLDFEIRLKNLHWNLFYNNTTINSNLLLHPASSDPCLKKKKGVPFSWGFQVTLIDSAFCVKLASYPLF